MRREPNPSAIARQMTLRAAARFSAPDYLESVVIGQPRDVKGQMDMIVSSVNICDHGLDGRVGIC